MEWKSSIDLDAVAVGPDTTGWSSDEGEYAKFRSVPHGEDAWSESKRRKWIRDRKKEAAQWHKRAAEEAKVKAATQAQAKAANALRKRPAAQTTPRKRPAAQTTPRKRPAAQKSSGSSGTTSDSHNGSYDEPPRSQRKSQRGRPSAKADVLSRLFSSGSAPFRGRL
eukprot:3529992-Pyramimonas_sp.AAC.1